MVVTPDFPCRKCTERSPGCHGRCEAYKATKAGYEAVKRGCIVKADKEATINDYRARSVERTKRRCNR